jgi:hypothetical protein
VKISCARCGKPRALRNGHVNRAKKHGLNLYCGRKCAGLARRKNKTRQQKVLEKRTYDIEYRKKNQSELKKKKAHYHKKTYDPEVARKKRKKRAKAHAEYCRRPEYKKWKEEYDRKRRAKQYGPYADAYLIMVDLNKEIKSRSNKYEIHIQNKTFGKAQKRDLEAQGPKRSYYYTPSNS